MMGQIILFKEANLLGHEPARGTCTKGSAYLASSIGQNNQGLLLAEDRTPNAFNTFYSSGGP